MSRKCPICGHAVRWEDEPRGPFCSDRCRLLDLANWADESYRVPAEEQPLSTIDGGADTPPMER